MRVPRRPTLVAALLMAWTAGMAGQSGPLVLGAETAGSPASRHQAINYEWGSGPASFHEVTAESERPRVAGLPRATLDGVDEARFGFSSVTAYFQRLQGSEDDRSWMTSSAMLQLWLVTARRDGRTRWWRLGAGEENAPPDIVFDPLWITDEPDKEVSPDDLVFASLARGAEPIVVARYGAKIFGANSGSTTTHHLLIDLRSGVPSALGYFDEVGHDCGGACTHYMCLYAVDTAVGCRWESAANDFVCAETLHRTDTQWITRRGSRRFRFSDGLRLPWTSASVPADLDPSVSDASVTAKSGDVAVVETVGAMAVIADVPVGARPIRLLGAPSLAWRFGARLFQATLEGSRRGPITEIGSRLGAPDGGPAPTPLGRDGTETSGFTPDGAPPRFASSVVAREGSTTIVRVTVSEGGGRGVYLVGLEDAGGRVLADAVLVATDGRSYRECGRWMVPATAVGMTSPAAPFRATLDVEPEGLVDDQGDVAVDENSPPAERCRKAVTLIWQSGQGFAVERTVPACEPRSGRRVQIDDDGNIGVATSAAAPPL